jgi:hypothetical protein
VGLAHTGSAATGTINTKTKISNVNQNEEKPRLQQGFIPRILNAKHILISCCSLHEKLERSWRLVTPYIASHTLLLRLKNISMTKIL